MNKPNATQAERTGAGVRLTCWECRSALGEGPATDAHFCSQCGKLQPLPGQTDYFSFFGLPRKLSVDGAQLEKRFHELSWKLHPDRFHHSSSYERELSLERTAVLNDAFRTLREPVSRAEYLLRLEGLRREGETKQPAPPDLLREVFELNEYLEELRTAKRSGGSAAELGELRHQLEKARQAFEQKRDQVLGELAREFAAWDEGGGRAVLERIGEILNRHSYLRNLVGNVSEELET